MTFPIVRLQPQRHRRVQAGHPWIYSNEIVMDGAAKALPRGAMAAFHTHDQKFLGVGSFNPHCLIGAGEDGFTGLSSPAASIVSGPERPHIRADEHPDAQVHEARSHGESRRDLSRRAASADGRAHSVFYRPDQASRRGCGREECRCPRPEDLNPPGPGQFSSTAPSHHAPSRRALTLLVHCDLDEATAARTALAVDLARRTGAHLIGVAACAPGGLIGARLAGASPAAAKHEVREALRRAADDFKTRAAEVERANFRCAAKPADVFLAEEAVSADLLIVGPQGSGSDGPLSLDTAGLVMSTGRPVLIAPEGLDRLDLRRAVVAWKTAREARRALLDALPWLAMAEAVMILHIIEEPDEQPDDDRLEQVRDWLSSRVARVEAVRRPGRLERDSVADDILDAAESFGAGLVVAGAYSRAPLSERLFGGVTREFLKRGRPARLLSH